MHDLHGEGAAVLDAAHALRNLAINYTEMEQYDKADDYHLQALSMYKQMSQNACSAEVAKALNNLAGNYRHMKQSHKALTMCI